MVVGSNRVAGVLLLLAALCADASAQGLAPPARDARPAPTSGDGVIKGQVVDATTGRGIPRAVLELRGEQASEGVVVVADDDGSFTFERVAAGRYRIQAAKPTYRPGLAPEPRRGRRAQAFEVAPGATLDKVVIPLHQASALSGRVIDRYGDPVPYAQVSLRNFPSSKRRRGVSARRFSTSTNDIGEFRMAPVEPGEYLLSAASLLEPIEQRPFPIVDGGVAFYPGVMSLDQASPLVVQEGESVSGVELSLFPLAPVKVSGIILTPDGARAATAVLSVGEVLAGEDRAHSLRGSAAGGMFELTLPPGVYDLIAKSTELVSGPPRAGRDLHARGTTRITVAGEPLEGVVVQLVPAKTVSGRLVFDGVGAVPRPAASAIQVFAASDGLSCDSGRTVVNPDYTFSFEINGDRCYLGAGSSASNWVLRAVTRGLSDLTLAPLAIRDDRPIADVVMTFTDRRTKLTADVTTAQGTRAEEFVILVFPEERAKRVSHESGHPMSYRLIRQIEPAADGRGTTEGLLPGDYLVVALAPDDVDQEGGAAFYQRLESVAQRITLTEGETRALALKLADVPDGP